MVYVTVGLNLKVVGFRDEWMRWLWQCRWIVVWCRGGESALLAEAACCDPFSKVG